MLIITYLSERIVESDHVGAEAENALWKDFLQSCLPSPCGCVWFALLERSPGKEECPPPAEWLLSLSGGAFWNIPCAQKCKGEPPDPSEFVNKYGFFYFSTKLQQEEGNQTPRQNGIFVTELQSQSRSWWHCKDNPGGFFFMCKWENPSHSCPEVRICSLWQGSVVCDEDL